MLIAFVSMPIGVDHTPRLLTLIHNLLQILLRMVQCALYCMGDIYDVLEKFLRRRASLIMTVP
jgi:hypothetical protein